MHLLADIGCQDLSFARMCGVSCVIVCRPCVPFRSVCVKVWTRSVMVSELLCFQFKMSMACVCLARHGM